jgi:hypothetical protein
LAITQRKILGYLNGAVVAYSQSQSKLKEQLAQTGHPAAPMDDGVETIPVASLNVARSCMQQILKDGAGQVPLSNVKRFFHSKCNSELSETSLGYAKLSELLRGHHFQDICTVELRDSGYVVVEAADAPASCISTDEGTSAASSETDEMEQERFCPDEPLNFDEVRCLVAPASVGKTGDTATAWKPLTPGTIAIQGYVIHNTFFDVTPTLPTPIRTGAIRRAKSLPKDVGRMNAESNDDTISISLADAQPAKTPLLISPSLVSPGRFWPPSPEVVDNSQNSFVWNTPSTQQTAYEPMPWTMVFDDFVHPQPPTAALGNNSSFLFLEQHI